MLGAVTPIDLRSDNTAGAEPYVLEALAAANTGTAASYGDDEVTARLTQRVSEIFEREAFVFPVVSGTAANAVGLSALCPPWGAVVCHEGAHILVNEAMATSMFTGGAALLGLAGEGSRLTTAALEACFERTGWDDPHQSQPAVLSVTQATEMGEVYQPEEIAALAELARSRGLRVHLDGARIGNALAALGCAPADLSWRAGVDMVSLGATKNGTMTADAIVTFDAAVAQELRFRLKRAGHVASKGRFPSVQLEAYLEQDRWLDSAGRANAAMARLVAGLGELGYRPVVPARANLAFVEVPNEVSVRWSEAGILFYGISPGVVRFVTSWATTPGEIDVALDRMRACATMPA